MKKTLICNLHFEYSCFEGKRLDLKSAIPTKYLDLTTNSDISDRDNIRDPSNNYHVCNPLNSDHVYTNSNPSNCDHISDPSSVVHISDESIRQNEPTHSRNLDGNANSTSSYTNCEKNELSGKNDILIKKLMEENSRLQKENSKLKNQVNYLKRKRKEEENSLITMKNKLKELEQKFYFSEDIIRSLENCVSEVPKLIFEKMMKRAKRRDERKYHPALQRFALSLHLCSHKAYR